MADDELAQKRHVGPAPMKGEPNADREKTYEPANAPSKVINEKQKLPERTAEDKVGEDMSDAVDAVKKRI